MRFIKTAQPFLQAHHPCVIRYEAGTKTINDERRKNDRAGKINRRENEETIGEFTVTTERTT
jgi:hypothetical protein